VYENLKRRRLNLLWHAYQLSGPAPSGRRVLTLEGQPAHNAGYTDDRVLNFDIYQLEQEDGAVEAAIDHRSYGFAGYNPYYLTDEGRRMLAAGYPLDS
jgi:hypothetical protein